MSIYKSGYPFEPGYKARDTARAAAIGIAQKAKSLRERVFDAIRERPGTPEEIAARLGVPLMNVRPRMSELSNAGRVRDSGARREADGGRKAIVWEAIDVGS